MLVANATEPGHDPVVLRVADIDAGELSGAHENDLGVAEEADLERDGVLVGVIHQKDRVALVHRGRDRQDPRGGVAFPGDGGLIESLAGRGVRGLRDLHLDRTVGGRGDRPDAALVVEVVRGEGGEDAVSEGQGLHVYQTIEPGGI